MRMTSALSCARCDVLYDLTYWFQELKDYMGEVKQDQSRIYNCEETGFHLALKTKKVIALKHDKHVYQGGMTLNKTQITVFLAASVTTHYVKSLVMYPGVQPRCELCDDYHCRFPEGLFGNSPSGWMDTELFHLWLENVTVLLGTSATTHYVKPLVMYPGVQPRCELCDDCHRRFPEGLFGNSPSGWMDTELFHLWLENGFNESLIERCAKKPVLLFISEAKCHISIQAREFCEENNIILYTLYPPYTAASLGVNEYSEDKLLEQSEALVEGESWSTV